MTTPHSPAREFYSCRFVEQSLIFHPFQMFHCCIPVNGRFGSTLICDYRGGRLPLDAIRASRERYRKAIADDEPSFHCHGCPYRERRRWDSQYLFSNILFNHSLLCNLRCTYCVQRHYPIEAMKPHYRALPIVRQLVEERLLSPDAYVMWAGGEPTFLTDFEESLDLMMSYGRTRNEIATNAAILSQAVLKNLRPDGRLSLKASVDCGTAETFRRLKKRDRFKDVWENLGRYASTGGDVAAKYIILTDNCELPELDGFVESACRAGIRHACIDIDFRIPAAEVQEAQVAAAAYLYRRLLAAGIHTDCGVHSTGSMPDFPQRVKAYPTADGLLGVVA